MTKIHVDCMIYQNTRDHHIVGSMTRITTDYVAGWCGVDVREKVSFDHYRGRLIIDVEGRKYGVKCLKPDAVKTVIKFLKLDNRMMEEYRIHEYSLAKAEVWQLDMWADPDGGWIENDRIRLGVIEIPKVCDSRKLCHLLRKRLYLPNAKIMPVLISKEFADSGRLEICTKDGKPFLSVEYIQEGE